MLHELTIAADFAAWTAIGLTADPSGAINVGTTRLRFVDSLENSADQRGATEHPESGIVGWVVGRDEPGAGLIDGRIDGLTTSVVANRPIAAAAANGPLGATRIDHVVVMTPSIERTCAAIAAVTGAPLKRIREVGGGVRQGFHRLGEVIVEVVERPDIAADAPAEFWGLVLVVADIEAAARQPYVAAPKPAVQPGRRIATIDRTAGLGLPVALMDDSPRA